jgi:hypothetical protein
MNLLEDARAIVARKWYKGGHGSKETGFCIIGALSEAACTYRGRWSEQDKRAYKEALARLVKHLPDIGWTGEAWLPLFNDHKDTTHADVLALFDRAIADDLSASS